MEVIKPTRSTMSGLNGHNFFKTSTVWAVGLAVTISLNAGDVKSTEKFQRPKQSLSAMKVMSGFLYKL